MARRQRLFEARLPRARRRCSSSSTAAPAGGGGAGARRRGEIADGLRRRRLPVGDRAPRTAAACGRRATTRYWATQGAAPRRAWPGRPTSACRSRGSPNASWRPGRTCRRSGLLAPIVGHVGDGNFHLTFLLDPDRPDEFARAPRPSTTAWSTGRWRWAAPAPASTASASARSAYLEQEHGQAVELMRAHQARARPAEHPQPGQDLPPRPRNAGVGRLPRAGGVLAKNVKNAPRPAGPFDSTRRGANLSPLRAEVSVHIRPHLSATRRSNCPHGLSLWRAARRFRTKSD